MIPLYVWYMWRIDNKADFDFDFENVVPVLYKCVQISHLAQFIEWFKDLICD